MFSKDLIAGFLNTSAHGDTFRTFPLNTESNMKRGHLASLRAFLRARLSTDGYLGLRLAIGALLMIGASWLFGSIAEDVATRDAITELDVQVSQWFHSNATKPLTQAMLVFTHIHGTLGISILSLLVGVFMLLKREWYWLLTLMISVPGGLLLNVALKHIFQRNRPNFDEPLLTLTTYSFPSGHAAGAAVFYGVLAAYLVCKTNRWPWRVVIAVLAALLVALVALSRVYLGVHYLSDVLAGIAESIAWLAFSFTVIGAFQHRRTTDRPSD
jgi:membrane-associated phospholipid phosphatase